MALNDRENRSQDATREASASSEQTLVNTAYPTKDSLVGITLDGRYYIEKELGMGGIGKVYLARDKPELISRHVVIKVLREDALKSEWTVNKFRHEVEALASIDDPGVTGVIDAGKLPDGAPYLVMQYVDGVTLRSMIEPVKDRGMDLESTGNIVRQVCCAVASAHKKGIYHRDLKPENIMVRYPNTGKEQIKVIDFGIAKLTNPVAAPGTVTERLVGTAAYMSPEQLRARPVTGATDIYSMGVIAYEMATGRRAFNFETLFQLAEMQETGVKLKPKDLRPILPAEAQNIILKALAYDPKNRFTLIDEFGDAFARALAEGEKRPEVFEDKEAENETLRKPDSAAVTGKRLLYRTLLLVSALLLIGGSILIAWKILKPTPEPQNAASGIERSAPTVTTRTMSYYLMVQRYRNGSPYKSPYLIPGEINFDKDDKVQLFFSSPEQGYFYLLNQPPKKEDGTLPNLIILFPEENKSALLPPNEEIRIPRASPKPYEDWIEFDAAEGTEQLWMVWSSQPVDELEATKKWSNRKELGEIRDTNQNGIVQEFLSEYHSVSAPDSKKNDEGTRTSITGKGTILVYSVSLQHH